MKTRLHGTTAGSLCSAHEERMLDQAQREERQAGGQGGLCPCVSMSGQRILLFSKKKETLPVGQIATVLEFYLVFMLHFTLVELKVGGASHTPIPTPPG